jgi:hypothetical protein
MEIRTTYCRECQYAELDETGKPVLGIPVLDKTGKPVFGIPFAKTPVAKTPVVGTSATDNVLSPWTPTKPHQMVALIAAAVILAAAGWPLFSLANWGKQVGYGMVSTDLFDPKDAWRWYLLLAGLIPAAILTMVAYWPFGGPSETDP